MPRPSLLLALLCTPLLACGDDGGDDGDVPTPDAAPPSNEMVARQVAHFTDAALLVTSPPDDARKFVVLREGEIRIVDGETTIATPFLDLSDENGGPVLAGGERGLLGLAFHPDYASNGFFYVFYTTAHENVIDRIHVSSDPDVADAASRTNILTIADPFSNHNGGMMEFGPDGYLYVGTGDGGDGGDPLGNGQNTDALLGKMLRLDVDHPSGGHAYGVPTDNPFVGGDGADEIYLYGVRNPWRWSFDGNGDLYIGDVGQDKLEELDVLPAGTGLGKNLGWNMYEASSCFDPPCDDAGKTFPQFERKHSDGWCSIIGGQVYRGSRFPELTGYYFFTDYCAPKLWRAKYVNGVAVEEPVELNAMPAKPSSIHADHAGDLYLTSEDGGVYVLEPAAP